MSKIVSILGSTGSIGTQSLKVCEKLGYRLYALTAHANWQLMEQQIRQFHPAVAVMTDPQAAQKLRQAVEDCSTAVLCGMQSVVEAAEYPQQDVVINALMGVAGLLPTVRAIQAGNDVALANKETLVAGGKLVMQLAKEKGVRLTPIDSEHSAIFQCLQGNRAQAVERLIITASGGPFYGRTREQLKGIKKEQALRHPNWSMGAKITIDSSTLMNKGLEFIEAMRLYHMPPEKISIVIHRESIVHSLVEYCDHAVLAQLGVPDMRLPIQYALTWPGRVAAVAEPLDLLSCPPLTFHAPDYVAFPCLALALEAARTGGSATAVLNGANEEAVGQFLAGQLSFSGIAEQVAYAMAAVPAVQFPSLGDILDADQAAREAVRGHRPDTH